MSMLRILGEGAGTALRLVPLLFVLGGSSAVHAQLPRAVPTAHAAALARAAPDAPAVIEPIAGAGPLTLAANHVEIHVGRERATVRTRLTYRNDGRTPIEAHYAVPLPAVVLQQPAGAPDPVGPADVPFDDAPDDPADAPAAPDDALAHEFAEAGEPDPRALQAGTLWIEPGDTVIVETRRDAALIRRAGRMRLVLPLVADPNATFTPAFSADVLIDVGAPVTALTSATHGGDVSGLGERVALLSVPNGRVYERRFLAVEFALGDERAPQHAQAPATLTRAIEWHGEGRALRRPSL